MMIVEPKVIVLPLSRVALHCNPLPSSVLHLHLWHVQLSAWYTVAFGLVVSSARRKERIVTILGLLRVRPLHRTISMIVHYVVCGLPIVSLLVALAACGAPAATPVSEAPAPSPMPASATPVPPTLTATAEPPAPTPPPTATATPEPPTETPTPEPPAPTQAPPGWVQRAEIPGSGRSAVAAAVLDDKVYVMGGLDGELEVLEYDPATDTWAEKASMLKGMVFASASVVDGKIYFMGGAPSMADSSHALVQEYNPAADTWTEKASLPTPREGLSSAAVDGRIYAIGGTQWDVTTSGGLVVSSVEMYDPATDTWAPKAPLPRPRTYAGAAILDGKIYVLGGATRVGEGVSSSMLMYDPGTDTWTEKSPMPGQRALSAAAVHDGRIYVFGGAESFTEPPPASSTVFEYDPAADTWTERGDMPFERRGMAAAVVSGKVYLFGGSKTAYPGRPFSREVWEYDPEAAD